ncbi:MAG: hypothetical protein ACNI3C_01975 [Candidatus Marinarcus sp.]|uniref:hypothetical protein n=1 Tax=Candidatus Marinarcus sp. TaxID=3100987 RepID=UPI003B00A04F
MIINFFCFQPILFNEQTFFYLQSNNFIPNKNWEKVDNNYKNSHCCGIVDYLKFIERHDLYLLNDFNNTQNYEFKFLNGLDFLHLNQEETTHAVFYDKDYKIFFIVFKISIELNSKFHTDNLIGLYQNIRNELVVDSINGNTTISKWAENIREYAIKSINEIFNDTKSCNIIENSGYIFSSYSNFDFTHIENIQSYKDDFLTTNHHIDLIDEKKESFENFSFLKSKSTEMFNYANSPYIFFLGWRFATIYGIKNSDDLKLIPIFLNLQNIYFQIDNFYKPYLSKLYEEIRFNNDYNSLNDKVEIFDKLEVAFQNLIFEKSKFISELKPFQSEIFEEMENYWGMQKDYDNIEKTLQICQTSLDRKLSIERNTIQEKQSNILFFLAIIQIFSVISISVDFFSLLGLKANGEHKSYLLFLENNLLLMLTATSFLLIFIAYYKQTYYRVKKLFKKST